MKIAFCLFKYFPFGGLQRDFIRIARACKQRGHEVHVYTMSWEGEVEPGIEVHILPTKGWQNHTRNHFFVKNVKKHIDKERPDVIVGFNKMPHLDMYYAADVCFQSRVHESHGLLYRLLPRYRRMIALEKAVFAAGEKTEIMLISPKQEKEFVQCYQTEETRFHLLPPGISKDRMAPSNASQIRKVVREKFKIAEDDTLLLMVGSGFKTKGLDRAIRGLAFLPGVLKKTTHLFVVGDDKPEAFINLAKKLNVAKQVHFLGGRSDVPHFLLAADLLVHPAYHENTGTVLLEAMISGLPVLTTDVCGYAHYLQEANAGVVLPSPFEQQTYNTVLQKMLLSPKRNQWRQNGLAFAESSDIYSLPEKSADLIERFGCKNVS